METSLLNLEEAIKNILKEDRKGDNHIPDPLRFSYVELNKKKLIKSISEKLNNKYKPQPLLEIDVPKPNFTIRPMARPEIEDWIIYQSIVDYIIKKIAKKVSTSSFSIKSFTGDKSEKMPWLLFDENNRKFFDAGYKYVVMSDITGYFEHIKIEELKNKLLNYSEDSDYVEIVNFLCNNLLSNWNSGRVDGFGLPQGTSASSFLGDVYLDTIDREMDSQKGYFRFMDDIRIFCKSEIEAKKALIKLIKILRKYKLSINAKKTKIISKEEIPRKLFDSKKPQLDAIEKSIDSGNNNKIQTIIPILIDDVFAGSFDKKNEFSKTHLNFSIFRIKVLKDNGFDFDEDRVVDMVLNNFISRPNISNKFCSFLSSFKNNKKIDNFLLSFLKSKENIYEWQEVHVLRCILELNIRPTKTCLKFFIKKFKDKNNHWALRSLYCLIIGKYGDNKDRELIKDDFDNLANNDFKKNILLSVQELGIGSRNSFYHELKKINENLSSFVDYIKTLKNPMYYRAYEKIKIEEFDDSVLQSYY